MSIYHFIYKTTNVINNKYYYGVHSTTDLDDGYLGSGVALRKAIAKHGKESFKREIIEFFATREEAFSHEQMMIDESVVADRSSYNMCLGGNGAVGTLIPSQESRKKRSDSMKAVWKARGGHPNKGKKYGPATEERKRKLSETMTGRPSPLRGTKVSDETIEKQKLAALNRPRHTCEACGGTYTIQTLTRYHGNKCKSLSASTI
jgi:group I intron endonuclease